MTGPAWKAKMSSDLQKPLWPAHTGQLCAYNREDYMEVPFESLPESHSGVYYGYDHLAL